MSLAQMVEAARWKFGAIRANASLSLTNAGYDTDIYYGYIEEPTPDATFSASIPIQILLPLGKTTVLELNDSPQYLFYLDTARERAWNNIFKGRVHIASERVYIQAGGGLSNVRRRMSPELDVNVREKMDSLDGTVLLQVSQKISLAALYEYARYDYGDWEFGGILLAESLNREEDYFDIVTYIEPTSKIRLFVDGQYGRYAFMEEEAIERDTRSFGVYGGLQFVPREDEVGPIAPPQGSISLGYKHFNVLDAASTDGSGFVGAIDVRLGLFSRTTAHASLSRDFAFSVYSDGIYYLSTAFSGGISRRLSRRATFSYEISFGQSAYPDVVEGEPLIDRNFHYAGHMFSLNIMLARHLGVAFQARLNRRTVGDDDIPARRSFFGLSLTYGVPSGSVSAPGRGLSLSR